MTRCDSIDNLSFHNFTLDTDSTMIKYDDSKADKDGEKNNKKMCMQTHMTMKIFSILPLSFNAVSILTLYTKLKRYFFLMIR